MNTNLRMRHSILKLIRRHLEDVHDFVEVDYFLQLESFEGIVLMFLKNTHKYGYVRI